MNNYIKEIEDSKFLGKEFEGFKVIKAYLRNEYKKQYGKDMKPTHHKEYAYTLENKEKNITFTISGNQLRLIMNGKRTIKDMLLTSHNGSSKNPEICTIRRKLLNIGWENYNNDSQE